MLVLSRKVGEEIVIDGDIRVKVVDISGSRVRLALCAPTHVPIRRNELPARSMEAEAEEFSVLLVGR